MWPDLLLLWHLNSQRSMLYIHQSTWFLTCDMLLLSAKYDNYYYTSWKRHLPFHTSHPVPNFKRLTQLSKPLIWMWTSSQSGLELYILGLNDLLESCRGVLQHQNINRLLGCLSILLHTEKNRTSHSNGHSPVSCMLCGFSLPYCLKWAKSAFFQTSRRLLPRGNGETYSLNVIPSHRARKSASLDGGECLFRVLTHNHELKANPLWTPGGCAEAAPDTPHRQIAFLHFPASGRMWSCTPLGTKHMDK